MFFFYPFAMILKDVKTHNKIKEFPKDPSINDLNPINVLPMMVKVGKTGIKMNPIQFKTHKYLLMLVIILFPVLE